MKDYTSYAAHYSAAELWKKCRKVAADAGKALIRKALELYFATKRKDMPALDKAKIYGALGYFIFPFDIIPDMLPGGYADDFAVMVFTYQLLSDYVGPKEKAKAKAKMADWGM